MGDIHSKITARLTMLRQARDEFAHAANERLVFLNGQITALEELLAELQNEVPPPPSTSAKVDISSQDNV